MMSFFQEMGVYFWPLALIALAVIGLALRSAARLRGNRPEETALVEHTINAVLFWGFVAAVVGVLGQFHGIYQALKVISAAGEVSPAIVWGGLAVSFSTTLAGLGILLAAALLWAALRGGLHHRERALAGA